MDMPKITSVPRAWSGKADALQDSVNLLYGAEKPQYLHNIYPMQSPQDDKTFNYWWLAHLIDCRLDAYLRTGDSKRLEQAQETWNNILTRNDGSLFNDYFDDMLWLALATLRMWEITRDEKYMTSVTELWNHIITNGWNDTGGESLSWNKKKLYYKNTPANGPLIILGARLYRHTHEKKYLDYARKSFTWVEHNLRDPDGFIEDGINREDDGVVDTQWQFTYNQGLYVGACVELYSVEKQPALLDKAMQTALVAIDKLSDGTVFRDEGEGGDEGLFKGIYYRYIGLLIDMVAGIPNNSAYATLPEGRRTLIHFINQSTDAMWKNACSLPSGAVAIGDDWSTPPQGRIHYSSMLSAVMASELRARLTH